MGQVDILNWWVSTFPSDSFSHWRSGVGPKGFINVSNAWPMSWSMFQRVPAPHDSGCHREAGRWPTSKHGDLWSPFGSTLWKPFWKPPFFPRASERRVLPIVGVCKTPSHLHIFSSSHLLIFSSSSHIFSSSHLTSSHLTSSPLALLPFALLPSPSFLFLSWRREQGQCQRDGTKRNPFARNEVRSPKTEVKLRFQLVPRNPFARNEVRSPKTEVKLRFQGSNRTLSHEMRFDHQKLK